MDEIRDLSPKRLIFDASLDTVPMMGAIAERFQTAPKADLRAEGDALAAELSALHASLEEHGIREPVPVTFMAEKVKGKLRRWVRGWDGRHRTNWALAKGLKTIPVRIVTEEQGRALLEATVIGRRHWTKGQRAWLAVCLHPEVTGNTRATRKTSHSVGSVQIQSVGDLAERYGVSAPLIDQAVKIHRLFSDLPSLREKHEPGIWIGHGLGAVIAGIPGATTTDNSDGTNPKKAISWTTLKTPLSTLSNVARHFGKWTADEKDCARDAFANWLRNLPEDFRLTLTEAVAQAAEGEAEDDEE